MAPIFGISCWGTGIMDGYISKEGGLPNTLVLGVIGLSGLITGIATLRRSSDVIASFIASPVIMGSVYGVGNLTGKAMRHTRELYSEENKQIKNDKVE